MSVVGQVWIVTDGLDYCDEDEWPVEDVMAVFDSEDAAIDGILDELKHWQKFLGGPNPMPTREDIRAKHGFVFKDDRGRTACYWITNWGVLSNKMNKKDK